MEKRSLLRTILNMGNRDSALEGAAWRRYLLTVASAIFLLGLVLLITKFANVYLRLTALTFIFFSLGGFVIVFTSLLMGRSYRTLPIVIGMILAGLMFLLGFVFFFISFQY